MDRRVRRTVLPLLFVLCGSVPRSARADAPPLTLTWTAPEDAGCADHATMTDTIGRMLGPDDGQRKRVTAEAAVVKRASAEYRVTLTLATDDTRATRAFRATTCREAGEATALIVALAIDSRAKAPAPDAPDPTPPPAPVVPEAAPIPAPPPPAPRRATPAPAPRSPPVEVALSLSARASAGSQPGAAFGGALSLHVTRGPLHAEAWLSLAPPTRAALANDGTKGGDLSALAFGGRACGLGAAGRVRLGPCVVAGVTLVRGTAFGTERTQTGSATWGTLGAEVLLRVALTPRIGLRGALGPSLALDRPTFVIATSTEKLPVFRPDPVGLGGEIGVDVRFF